MNGLQLGFVNINRANEGTSAGTCEIIKNNPEFLRYFRSSTLFLNEKFMDDR
jgi:hypothetical protein